MVAKGFETSPFRKVPVAPEGSSAPDVDDVIAVVSDTPLACSAPTYGFDMLEDFAEQLRTQLLRPRQPAASVSLVVDGVSVPLRHSPSHALAGKLRGVVSSLPGVTEDPSEIRITVTFHPRG